MRTLFALALLAGCARVDHFPTGTLDPQSQTDEWFSGNLVALHEPSLAAKAADRRAHVVRVLLLPDSSGPISLRMVVHRHGGGVLIIRKAGRIAAFGHQPGLLRSTRRVVLTRHQVARVLTLLTQMDFWIAGPKMGYRKRYDDGTEVVLEATRDGRHHVVHDDSAAELARVARLLSHYARLRR